MSQNEKDSPAVFSGIVSVMRALASKGIEKSQKNTHQNYKFRGIDNLYNALAPLLAHSELCILPVVLERAMTERETAKGGVMFSVVVHVDYHIVSAKDGSKVVVRTVGEAMDSGDKASNKALSAAYKYMAFQTFCIPTEGSDSDSDPPVNLKPKSTSKNSKAGIEGVKVDDLHMELNSCADAGSLNKLYTKTKGVSFPDESSKIYFRNLLKKKSISLGLSFDKKSGKFVAKKKDSTDSAATENQIDQNKNEKKEEKPSPKPKPKFNGKDPIVLCGDLFEELQGEEFRAVYGSVTTGNVGNTISKTLLGKPLSKLIGEFKNGSPFDTIQDIFNMAKNIRDAIHPVAHLLRTEDASAFEVCLKKDNYFLEMGMDELEEFAKSIEQGAA